MENDRWRLKRDMGKTKADRKKIYVQRKEGDEKKKLGWKRRER